MALENHPHPHQRVPMLRQASRGEGGHRARVKKHDKHKEKGGEALVRNVSVKMKAHHHQATKKLYETIGGATRDDGCDEAGPL
jgi:hypothetical protein